MNQKNMFIYILYYNNVSMLNVRFSLNTLLKNQWHEFISSTETKMQYNLETNIKRSETLKNKVGFKKWF